MSLPFASSSIWLQIFLLFLRNKNQDSAFVTFSYHMHRKWYYCKAHGYEWMKLLWQEGAPYILAYLSLGSQTLVGQGSLVRKLALDCVMLTGDSAEETVIR